MYGIGAHIPFGLLHAASMEKLTSGNTKRMRSEAGR